MTTRSRLIQFQSVPPDVGMQKMIYLYLYTPSIILWKAHALSEFLVDLRTVLDELIDRRYMNDG